MDTKKKYYPFKHGEEVLTLDPYMKRNTYKSKFDSDATLLRVEYLICPRCKKRLEIDSVGQRETCSDCGLEITIYSLSSILIRESNERILAYREQQKETAVTNDAANALRKEVYAKMLESFGQSSGDVN